MNESELVLRDELVADAYWLAGKLGQRYLAGRKFEEMGTATLSYLVATMTETLRNRSTKENEQ